MAEPRKLDPELSEPERRDLVRRMTERGSRAARAEETTVRPSIDYAAAAEAAVRADPVVLPPSAQEELAGITGAVADEAGRFAAAQREIFERGRQRELGAGQRFFDQGALVREAQDFALARYSEQLAEADAERQRRAASSASDSPLSFVGDPQPMVVPPLLAAAQGLQGPRQAIAEPVLPVDNSMRENALNDFFTALPGDQVEDAVLLTGTYEDIWEEGMAHALAYYGMGKSYEESQRLLTESMVGAGLPAADAQRLAEYIMKSYSTSGTGLWETTAEIRDPFRYAIPGLEEQTRQPYYAPVTGQPANTPRPDTYLTSTLRSERESGRDYYAPSTGQAANVPRQDMYLTSMLNSERESGRDYYAPRTGQPANTPRRETYSSRMRNTTQPQTIATRPTTRARPEMAGAPNASAAFADTAYGQLLEKYGIG